MRKIVFFRNDLIFGGIFTLKGKINKFSISGCGCPGCPGGTCPDEWSEEPPWPDNWGIDDEYWVAGEVGSYNQNNQAQCNAQCNGWTYCGDGTAQNPNGAGAGGPGDDGIEECDDGLNNSDTEANACRTNCADPWCGDGVDDTLTEECDFQDYEAPTPYYSDEDSQYQCTPGCLDTGGYCGDTITQGAFAEECDDGKHCSDLTSCTEDVDCTDIGDELCRKRSGTGCSSVCLTES